MGPSTLPEAIASFLRWAELRFRPNTVKLYRHYLYHFRDQVGKVCLTDIKRIDIETFSVKKVPLEVLRRFCSWCVDVAELLVKSPAHGVRVPKSGRRSRIFTRAEMVSLRRRAGRPLRALLLALEESGARPIEIRRAEWGNLKTCNGEVWSPHALEQGECFIELEHYKGQARRTNPWQKRVIPISPRLGRLIFRLHLRNPLVKGPIFLSFRGSGWTANALRCGFRRLRPNGAPGTGDVERAIVPYTYRHSLATALAHEGTNARLLADFLGHSRLDLLAWYVHPSTADLCKLLRRDR